MTEVAKVLQVFFESFGIPAYVEESIPDDAVLPYITYSPVEPSWGQSASLRARVWYKDSKKTTINSKVSDIKEAIGEGKSMQTDTGFIIISPDILFAQPQPYDDAGKSNVQVVYLSMIIQVYTRR